MSVNKMVDLLKTTTSRKQAREELRKMSRSDLLEICKRFTIAHHNRDNPGPNDELIENIILNTVNSRPNDRD